MTSVITNIDPYPSFDQVSCLRHSAGTSSRLVIRGKPQPVRSRRVALPAGIALGTDSAVSPYGENANEFIEYVNAGISEMEALTAGTVNAAEAGGFADRAGSLAPGKAADIVAMAESPLDDIDAVLDVQFVMRDGVVFKQPEQ
jgi:imidazolonepropionase-like amidohydrolase